MYCVEVLSSMKHASLDPLSQRQETLERLDVAFLHWFVSRHAKEVTVLQYCVCKGIVVNVHERYRNNIKNIGKKNFDLHGSDDARMNFMQWALANELDVYIHRNYTTLQQHYKLHKEQIYMRYKQKSTKPPAKKKRRKSKVPESVDLN